MLNWNNVIDRIHNFFKILCVMFDRTAVSHPISLPPESISILSIALAILIPTKCFISTF